MKEAVFKFSYADILSRRGDFSRDIRTVGNAKGEIISCHLINDGDDFGPVTACFNMTDYSGKRFSIISLTAFFDRSFVCDTIIIPELKLAFLYHWGISNFNTGKLLRILDEACYRNPAFLDMGEHAFLTAAAAVCALYEWYGRSNFDERCWRTPREMIVPGC